MNIEIRKLFRASGDRALLLSLLVYSVLIVFSPDFIVGSFESHVIEFRLSDLFFLGLAGYLGYSVLVGDREFSYPALFFPALAYAAVFFLGALVAFLKVGAGLGLQSTFFAVKYMEYFLIFFVTANLVRTEGRSRFLLNVFFWLATSAAGLLVITRFVDPLHLTLTVDLSSMSIKYHWMYNDRATLPFAKGFGPSAEFLSLFVPFGLFFFINSSNFREKILQLIGLGLLGFGFVLTGSRGPMVGLFLAVVLLAPLLERKLLPWLIAGGIGISGLYFISPFIEKRVNSILIIFSKGPCANSSLCTRVTEIWPEGFAQFLNNPILGGGLASFPTSDSQYVRLLADLGIIGIGTFLFFIGSLLFYLIRSRDEATDCWKVSVFSAMIIATAALLVNGITATAFEPVRAMEPFWYLLGLVFAFEKTGQVQEPLSGG